MMSSGPVSSLTEAISLALVRSRTLDECAAVLLAGLDGPVRQNPGSVLSTGVRSVDVVEALDERTFGVLLRGIGRLSAASVAERLEVRLDDAYHGAIVAHIGMAFIGGWEVRSAQDVLVSAQEDLRQRQALLPSGDIMAA